MLLGILIAALVIVLIVIVVGIVFLMAPVYHAPADIEIASETHPLDRVFGLIQPARREDSLAMLDEMRGPRPGGRRARRK